MPGALLFQAIFANIVHSLYCRLSSMEQISRKRSYSEDIGPDNEKRPHVENGASNAPEALHTENGASNEPEAPILDAKIPSVDDKEGSVEVSENQEPSAAVNVEKNPYFAANVPDDIASSAAAAAESEQEASATEESEATDQGDQGEEAAAEDDEAAAEDDEESEEGKAVGDLQEDILLLQRATSPIPPRRIFGSANRYAARDIALYQDGYPDFRTNPHLNDNVRFYRNEIVSTPDGDVIDNIHKHWRGDYGRLEQHHGYIQWLFPIHEPGMNSASQVLQRHEAKIFRKDAAIRKRVLKSLDLMLDFYGFKLTKAGSIQRNEDNYRSRFLNLSMNSHNNLRITRILKALGEYDLEHLKAKILVAFLREIIVNKELKQVASSCAQYWIPTLRDGDEREALLEIVNRFS